MIVDIFGTIFHSTFLFDSILMKDSFEVSQESYGEYDILHPVPIQIFIGTKHKRRNINTFYLWMKILCDNTTGVCLRSILMFLGQSS